MAKAKKKSLPKNFEDLLAKGDVEELIAVFDGCLIDARGGYGKQTALAFDNCPDELAKWLVAQGIDLEAADTWGNTPLHSRSRGFKGRIKILIDLGADVNNAGASIGAPLHAAVASYNLENSKLLIEHGAIIDALNREGFTPLEYALCRCSNIDIQNMVKLAEFLLSAGAKKTSRMKGFVEEIGKRFEFHREAFNKDMLTETDASLEKLYDIFQVSAVAKRKVHDGISNITIAATNWQKQYEELWELLIPSSGSAETLQGETIRIAGRIRHEIEGNGGVNWDKDYIRMADTFLYCLEKGKPLSVSELQEAAAIVKEVKRKSGDTLRMAELAVKWVMQNPAPIKLGRVEYNR